MEFCVKWNPATGSYCVNARKVGLSSYLLPRASISANAVISPRPANRFLNDRFPSVIFR